MRRWHPGASAADFRRIAPATRIYRTDDPVEPWGLTLHTVTTCDIAKREMECESTGVLGPAGRVFYVSQGSVYVWTTRNGRQTREAQVSSAVFRIPLEGGAPTALKTSGSPVDQLSFLESGDGHLNVLLRARGRGEAMWAAESTAVSMARCACRSPLLRRRESAPSSAYRRVPSPSGHTRQNRLRGPLPSSAAFLGGAATASRANAPALRGRGRPVQTISILTAWIASGPGPACFGVVTAARNCTLQRAPRNDQLSAPIHAPYAAQG